MAPSEKQSFKKKEPNYLRIHLLIVALLYVTAICLSYKVLSLSEAQKDLVTLISTGAILATFGSALGAIGQTWQADLVERIKYNVDILFRDILGQAVPWRRWSFLPRLKKRRLLDGNHHEVTLKNPDIGLDVGTHILKIDVPTVLEDFFDLALLKNFWNLWRFRNSAHTIVGRKKEGEVSAASGLDSSDEYMAYEALFDTWKSILKFRISRYIIHFGSGLTIAGAILTAIYVLVR